MRFIKKKACSDIQLKKKYFSLSSHGALSLNLYKNYTLKLDFVYLSFYSFLQSLKNNEANACVQSKQT